MDKDCKRQTEELSEIWHSMMMTSSFKDIESKFQRVHALSTTELAIIRIIYEREDAIIKDILEILKIPKSTLTNIINKLEKCNLIKRTISDRDKRSYRLILTDEGMLVQKEHIEFEKTVYGEIIMALDSNEEREEFLRLMRKIVENIFKGNN